MRVLRGADTWPVSQQLGTHQSHYHTELIQEGKGGSTVPEFINQVARKRGGFHSRGGSAGEREKGGKTLDWNDRIMTTEDEETTRAMGHGP